MRTSKVLVVDDDPEVLDLMAEFLRGLGIEVRMARDGGEALQVFGAEPLPLVITDLKMPGMDGLELMKAIKEASPQTEILIITAHGDLDSAIQAVRHGAFDYLPKPFHLETVGRRVTQALERHGLVVQAETLLRELEQRVEARTAALEESQRRLRALFNGIPDPLLIVDETRMILAANNGAAAHSGAPSEDLVGRKCHQAIWGRDTPCQGCPVVRTFATGQPALGTMTRDAGREGGRREYDCRSYPLETAAGARKEAVEHLRDVTEQRQAEEASRALEAQRKVDEAIRVISGLAAGAAHDLNTLFTIIEGSARFLLEATPGGDPRRSDGERIFTTAERGLRLVRELLAIGSVSPAAVHPVNVARLFGAMLPALRSLMGDQIALNVRAPRRPWRVRANPAHIEQLIMNLVANARDAMAADRGRLPGGTLTLEISNVAVDETSPPMAIEGLAPGKYVMLVVRDTGCGMPPEVRRRVFEPFFTTKAPGKGTGLGLATVEWVVRRYNGHVACETEAGRGTTFRVYLPRCEKK